MKKFLVLGLGVVAFFAVASIANAQFVVGDRVQATAHVNVRSTPGGVYLGSAMMGDYGTIVGGPVIAPVGTSSPFTWWNVNYDIGVDGWSVGDYLMKVPTATTTLPVDCGDVNKDGFPDQVDVGLVINVAFRGQTYLNYNTDVDGNGVTNILDVTKEIDYVYRGGLAPTGCVNGSQSPASSLSLSMSPIGSSSGRAVAVVDDIARLSFTAGNGGDVYLRSVRLSFVGSALDNNNNFPAGVVIYDQDTGVGYGGTAPSCTNSNCFITINFGKPPYDSLSGYIIAAGQTKNFTVRIDSHRIGPARNGLTPVLAALIEEIPDVKYDDVSTRIMNLTLPSYLFPISITSFSYAQGTGGSAPSPVVVSSFTGPTSNIQPGVWNSWIAIANDSNVLCGGSPCNLNYTFNWGDGSAVTTLSNVLEGVSASAQHSYNYSGNYTIKLTVSDLYGYSVNASKFVSVGVSSSTPTSTLNQPPTIPSGVSGFTGPTGLNTGQTGTWYVKGVDPEGGLLTYRLVWGDGSSSTQAAVPSGQQRQFTHAYGQVGTYPVTFSVYDNQGLSVQRQLSVSVFAANHPPVMSNFSVNSPVAPGSMTSAYIYATDADNDPLSYWISWGDGQGGGPFNGVSGVYPTHVYVNQGTYYASSSVYDGRGGWAFGGPVTVSIYSTSTPSQPLNPLYQPTTVTYQCGDLNKSGAVDVADKLLMQSYWTGGVPVPAGVNADLNGDGAAADILDYSVLNNYLTKGMAAPTCGGSTGGTRNPGTLSPSASVLSAMQYQLDAIKSQLISILQSL